MQSGFSSRYSDDVHMTQTRRKISVLFSAVCMNPNLHWMLVTTGNLQRTVGSRGAHRVREVQRLLHGHEQLERYCMLKLSLQTPEEQMNTPLWIYNRVHVLTTRYCIQKAATRKAEMQ